RGAGRRRPGEARGDDDLAHRFVREAAGLLVAVDRHSAESRDVARLTVDVGGHDTRAGVEPVAADEAGDRHLSMRLGHVAHEGEDADVHPSGGDVTAPAWVDVDAPVVEDALLERALRGHEPADERPEADGPVVAAESDDPVGERGPALEAEDGLPRVLPGVQPAEVLRQPLELVSRGGHAPAMATRSDDAEDESPVHVL